ncbi:DUF202 domain-containing protein [Nocardioides sp. GY 10127]|uniref:DUF202 domain-containing protein n=1 Tax=Nocardioides sp. GY 10127 TaxID=2569762 RepID=UPI0010A8EB3C|nr:DUF202 domain-containing protein [Nocardioides sp. GY 10127]TIC84473.1 DUF202 domain-containing protein [Nocardioides sp. GY 10127]
MGDPASGARRPDPTVGVPRDPGAQHERTGLAWQRTGLSVAVAAVAATRLAWVEIGPLALVDLVVALALLGWFARGAAARTGRRAAGLSPSPAVGPALVAGAVVVLGAVELGAVVASAL